MNLLYLSAGFILGGIIFFIIFYLQNKNRFVARSYYEDLQEKFNQTHSSFLIAEEKNKAFEESTRHLNLKLSETEKNNAELLQKSASAETNISALNKGMEDLKQKSAEAEIQKENLRNEITLLKSSISDLKAQNQFLNEKLETQKILIEETKKGFQTEFENIANKILDDKTKKFTDTNKVNIENLLKPFGEHINEFRKKVEDETKERFSLGQKVKELIELNQKLSEEANNLTTALKGQAKKQGNWGEIILESILEKSGLQKGREYFIQENLKDEEGKNLRPDVIIDLPGSRSIIIDSKVSLNAYERYSSSDDKEEQDKHIQDHLRAVYSHIDGLSSKKYDQIMDKTLDFVMMFIPIEPAYMIAIQNDADLWSYAYSKHILLISPTNLIAALKLIADLWQREQQSRNAQEIALQGAKLYEKLVTFTETLNEIGKSINKSQDHFEKAMNQLKSGRGNLIVQAGKLRELGIKPKKELPSNFLPDDTEEEELKEN